MALRVPLYATIELDWGASADSLFHNLVMHNCRAVAYTPDVFFSSFTRFNTALQYGNIVYSRRLWACQ